MSGKRGNSAATTGPRAIRRKKSAPRKGRKPTLRQRALMRGLLAGKPLGKAAVEAGYTRETAESKGYRLLARHHWATLLAKAGLDDETLVNKYLKRLLEGRITKYFSHKGKVVDKRQMISHEATARGLDLSLRLLDALPRVGQEDEAHSQGPPAIHFHFRDGAAEPVAAFIRITKRGGA